MLNFKYLIMNASFVIICIFHLAIQAIALTSGTLPRSKLIKSLSSKGLDESTVNSIVEAADDSIKNWSHMSTSFMSPYDCDMTKQAFSEIADVKLLCIGGYKLAERQRIVFSRQNEHENQELSPNIQSYLACISIHANFLFNKPTAADIIDAIMSSCSEIRPHHIGDVVMINDRGSQVIIDPKYSLALCQNLTNIKSESVSTQLVDLSNLLIKPLSERELVTIESSLRLDSLASAGLNLSRTKVVKMIESGLVMVDWKTILSSSTSLRANSVVQVKGVGKMTILGIETTSKGKYKVKIHKIS